MRLTWLGAAGFRVETDEGAIFLIDPFLSRPAGATPPLPLELADLFPVDEIFLTNGCFDHAMDTPALVHQTGAMVHAPAAVINHLAGRGVSPHSLQAVTFDQIKQVGRLSWQALPGRVNHLDASPSLRALIRNQALFPTLKTLDQQWPLGGIVSYRFETPALSLLYFSSANAVDSEVRDLRPDLALLPAQSTPAPDSNSVRLATLLNPKVVVPHHWDNYYPGLSRPVDVGRLAEVLAAQGSKIKVFVPEIGVAFEPERLLEA